MSLFRLYMTACAACLMSIAAGGICHAQTQASTSQASSSQGDTPAPSAADARTGQADASSNVLVLHFDLGSSTIRPEDIALLDRASRLFRDAHPLHMILTAGTDTVGSADLNLRLSQARAFAVLQGLLARGLPAERFQLVADGETSLAVVTPEGVEEARNRRVEISWR